MKNKTLIISLILVLSILLASCEKDIQLEINKNNIDDCNYQSAEYANDQIKIKSLSIDNAEVIGYVEDFINICKKPTESPIVLKDTVKKTYQLVFELDAIYPVETIEIDNYFDDVAMQIKSIDIDVSIDGRAYQRILEDVVLNETTTTVGINQQVAFMKISFSSTSGIGNNEGNYFALNGLRFYLGEGLIVKEDLEWTDAFMQYDGWSGADGIFSFNLTNGIDDIGAEENKTLFIFSDTIIGDVYEHNSIRGKYKIVNNTLAYYNNNPVVNDGLEFVYEGTKEEPLSVFLPDEFIGYSVNNLINQIGLDNYNNSDARLTNVANGSMYQSGTKTNVELTFDMLSSYKLNKLYMWNYNDELNYDFGIKDFTLSYSSDNITYHRIDNYVLSKASGIDLERHSLINGNDYIDLLDISARYLKITLNSNYQDVFTNYGLGKIMIFDDTNRTLFANVTTTSVNEEITDNEITSRLWLQDGVVVGDNFYIFPILVKDYENYFKVHKSLMIKIPIVNEKPDYKNAKYLDAPLLEINSLGEFNCFGIGLMNNTITQDEEYIYMYGYTDQLTRNLNVVRFKPENIENFNEWEYYTKDGFSKSNENLKAIAGHVSAELSVTYITEGVFKGKYMLVVMEDTTSGKVSYALSDTPYGPFTDYTLLYIAKEPDYLKAFTYNAKMHPSLSEKGELLISYNVNASQLSWLVDADIYRPRFIRVVEVKTR